MKLIDILQVIEMYETISLRDADDFHYIGSGQKDYIARHFESYLNDNITKMTANYCRSITIWIKGE